MALPSSIADRLFPADPLRRPPQPVHHPGHGDDPGRTGRRRLGGSRVPIPRCPHAITPIPAGTASVPKSPARSSRCSRLPADLHLGVLLRRGRRRRRTRHHAAAATARVDPVCTKVALKGPVTTPIGQVSPTDSMAIEDELPQQERQRLTAAVGLSDGQKTESDATIAKPTRADFVKAWVRRTGRQRFDKLAEKFHLRGYVFHRADGASPAVSSSGPPAIRSSEHKPPTSLTTTGQVTALGKGLEDLALRHATSNLAGLVVVSDFDQNSGPSRVAKAKIAGRADLYGRRRPDGGGRSGRRSAELPLMMKKAERRTRHRHAAAERPRRRSRSRSS